MTAITVQKISRLIVDFIDSKLDLTEMCQKCESLERGKVHEINHLYKFASEKYNQNEDSKSNVVSTQIYFEFCENRGEDEPTVGICENEVILT